MRFLAEAIGDVVHALRIVTPWQWALRLACAGSLAGAAVLCLVWFPVLGHQALLAASVGAALWSAARPESWAPPAGIGAVALWWLAGAQGTAWWQGAAVAGLLAVFHLTAAHAAAAPSYAAIRRRVLVAGLGRGLGYLAACAGAILLVTAIAAVPAEIVPRGLVWIVLALAAVLAATALALARLDER